MTTPTQELIERLRSYQAYCPQTDRSDHPICAEAASRLTELQDEVVRLRSLCREAADLYCQGGVFPIHGEMSERLRRAAELGVG